MTSQASEICRLGGTDYEMLSDPLESYLEQLATYPDLSPVICSSCWRGYRGHWEIKRGKLYLHRLLAPCGTRLAKVGRLFPGCEYPIAATWFTGKLRLQVGEELLGFYAGWNRVHEGERILHVRSGVVVRERHVDTRRLWKKLSERDWDMLPNEKAMLASGEVKLWFWRTAWGAARPYLAGPDES